MFHPLLRRRGLYAITDGPRVDPVAVAEAALGGGAVLLQYRDKTRDHRRRLEESKTLGELCARFGVPLIINDDVELALASGAGGVHLGQDDAPVALARAALGSNAIIGVSCYDSLERARGASAEGADYLAFGAFFPSATKPAARSARREVLDEARAFGKPLVAIGGITPDNGGSLIAAGADFLAVVGAVSNAPDVRAAARRFTGLFESTPAFK